MHFCKGINSASEPGRVPMTTDRHHVPGALLSSVNASAPLVFTLVEQGRCHCYPDSGVAETEALVQGHAAKK